jgi:hypothetical protein
MRFADIPHTSPRALPTPIVNTLQTQQPVDLKPMGNTVAVIASAQNPFTQSANVTVVTQASGGMAKAPAFMQSRGLVHSMMPGLGADPNTANQGAPATTAAAGGTSWLKAGTDVLSQVGSVFANKEQAKVEQARAEAEKQRAITSGNVAAAAQAQARVDALIASMGGAKSAGTWRWAMIGLAAAAAGTALILMRKAKKSGLGITGRRRR